MQKQFVKEEKKQPTYRKKTEIIIWKEDIRRLETWFLVTLRRVVRKSVVMPVSELKITIQKKVFSWISQLKSRKKDVKLLMQTETIILRMQDLKSTRLNSSHVKISYAVFCLKKKIA